MAKIPSYPAKTTPATGDLIVIEDVSAGNTKKMTLGDAMKTIQLTTGTVNTAAIADGAVTFAKLASTIFGGAVSTYTNTGPGAGTGYYINLGGIKLCWGTTGPMTISGMGNINISMPVGFFTAVRHVSHDKFGSVPFTTQQGGAPTTTTTQVYFSSGTGTAYITWLVIGS